MSRTPVAILAGTLFVFFYVVVALLLWERLAMPALVMPLYWCVAGLLWVLPIRWLMLWAVHKR